MDQTYSGSTTTCSNAYSSFTSYGSNETVNPAYNPIINPVPAVAVPQIFCRFKPHEIYQPPDVYCDNSSCRYRNLESMRTCPWNCRCVRCVKQNICNVVNGVIVINK
jgi:hypothetical protein